MPRSRIVIIGLAVVTVVSLACLGGCETVKGLGRDITNLGSIFD